MARYKCNSCGAVTDTEATEQALRESLGYEPNASMAVMAPDHCGACGSPDIVPVSGGAETPVEQKPRMCGRCGEEIARGSAVCGQCGKLQVLSTVFICVVASVFLALAFASMWFGVTRDNMFLPCGGIGLMLLFIGLAAAGGLVRDTAQELRALRARRQS